jgi:predicted amidohydrolase YtcJ
MDEAIAAYTTGSAWIGHRETHTGRIEVGYDADLVVVDRPIDTPDDAFAARVDLTMVDGNIVYEA